MEHIISKRADKFLQKIPHRDAVRIVSAIKKLPAGDVKKLANWQPTSFRLRVGDYRVIYYTENNMNFVENIGGRGEIYKR